MEDQPTQPTQPTQQMEQPPLYGSGNAQQDFRKPQTPLPNGGTILALGIISIVGCCCSYGVIGLICSIIAMVMAKSAEEAYRTDPTAYTESSYSNMKTGKVCALIGLILSILYLLLMIVIVIIYGMAIFTDPQSIIDMYS